MTKVEADAAVRFWEEAYLKKKIEDSLSSMGLNWEDLHIERGLSLESSYRVLLLSVGQAHKDPHVRTTAYLHLANDAAISGANPLEYLRRYNLASLDEIEQDGQRLDITHVRISAGGSACQHCADSEGEILSILEARERMPIPRPGCGKDCCRCRYEMVFPDEL